MTLQPVDLCSVLYHRTCRGALTDFPVLCAVHEGRPCSLACVTSSGPLCLNRNGRNDMEHDIDLLLSLLNGSREWLEGDIDRLASSDDAHVQRIIAKERLALARANAEIARLRPHPELAL